MIWFTVLRSYKDAHAKKIVQRILNGTDKDKLLETVVQLETEQQFQAIWKSGCRDFGQT
jgi:EAL domain-containing protein (putative c-di-GMP-specific phosphodiesterase class I)